MGKGESPNRKPVALIAGPTASGKSAIALRLASARLANGLQTVIINADSMQVYRDIPVLAATPDTDEQSQCPHKLYGAWDGAEACSAADWAVRAKQEIAKAHDTGALPVLVGGTGMYMKVLLEGIAPIPDIDPEIREQVRAMDTADAYLALESEDPERAALLEPTDSQRIARALEVMRSTGQPLNHWQERKTGGIEWQIELHPLILLPNRDWLYERCDRRFESMLESGAIDEVRNLLDRGLDHKLPVMRAIGVPEIVALVKGELSRAEAITAGQQSTRNYAKRQYTWFRRQPPKSWPRAESINNDVELYFASLLQS
ncbi:MAG: tRNA (adenosine(37)-N6)-dimethylallyltransferase MiaA [Altererythrobacter ishigakiensis]|nr:tRNA (adenosine(37)-N6)-dimethylallyltransferase MiaA [Altererythrobacter ishigakiensis]